MCKLTSRRLVYDALFVIVVMLAAMASAVLEEGAVLGAWPSTDDASTARSTAANAGAPAAAGTSVEGALFSAAPSSAH